MPVKRAVSVIVPLYNVAPYIIRNIDALSRQNPEIIEIIFVNDGSTDDTVNRLRTVLAEHSLKAPWRILEKPNGGLSDARNFGLEHSESEFVAFLDPDDDISDGFYEDLLNRITETGASVAQASMLVTLPDGKVHARTYKDAVHSTEENADWLLKYDWSACTKLFRRSLFSGDKFDKGLRFEDLALVPYITARSGRFCTCGGAQYHYYRRNDSIMLEQDIEKENDIFIVLERISERLEAIGCGHLSWRLIQKVLVLSFIPSVTKRYRAGASRDFAIHTQQFLLSKRPPRASTSFSLKALVTRSFIAAPAQMRWIITALHVIATTLAIQKYRSASGS